MAHNPEKYLEDMINAAGNVGAILGSSTLAEYCESLTLRSAVERQLEITGEALYQLERRHPSIAVRIVQYREIIRFRHVLAHGYDIVDNSTVYAIATEKVPVLRIQVKEILREFSDIH